MKQFLLLMTTILVTACTAKADNDKPVTVDQLPATAQQFITTHFSEVKVAYAKMETEFFDKSYEVVFTNGDKVEFDSKGEWKDVECKFTQVPEGIVPQQIKDYIATNYQDVKMLGIDRDKRDYEVKLSNRLELKFDLQFNLIEIDD